MFVAIEMKQPGKEPTPLQKLKLATILRSGGVSGVAHSLDEFKAIVHKAEGYSDSELDYDTVYEEVGGTSDD